MYVGRVRVTVSSSSPKGQNDRVTPCKTKVRRSEMEEDREALDLQADWADISQGLRKDLGQQLHSQWIKPIQLGTFCKDTGTLDLFLPTEFSANWVTDRFSDRLSLAWKIARPDVRHVRISVQPGRRQMPELRFGANGTARSPANDAPRAAQDAGLMAISGPLSTGGEDLGQLGQAPVGLDPSLTFTTFVTGTANVLAFNAAQRMAAMETPQFSPLYLKAATGQ